MSNQTQLKNKIPSIYNVGDIADLASLARDDMHWMETILRDLRIRVAQLKLDVKHHNIHDAHFMSIETFQKEWEQLKGGRNA